MSESIRARACRFATVSAVDHNHDFLVVVIVLMRVFLIWLLISGHYYYLALIAPVI